MQYRYKALVYVNVLLFVNLCYIIEMIGDDYMICPKCKKENPTDATFCNSCGSLFQQMQIKKKSGCLKIAGIVFAAIIVLIVILMIVAVNSPKDVVTSNSTTNGGFSGGSSGGGGGGGGRGAFDDVVNAVTNTNTNTNTNSNIEEKPMIITAVQLAKEYEENELLADRNYKGKLLEISGVIDDIGTDILGTAYFTLKTDNYYIVQCMVSKEGEDKLMEFKKGDGIQSTKICTGKILISIILDYKK
jgi:ribosomal protein L40E